MKLRNYFLLLCLLLAACVQVDVDRLLENEPTDEIPQPVVESEEETAVNPTAESDTTSSESESPPAVEGDLTIRVDAQRDVRSISPLIYGMSGATPAHSAELSLGLNSWGGNPSSRYNWELGNAWNAGSDWFYRNGNYGFHDGSASDMFFEEAAAANMDVRLAVPTLGWVAKDDHNDTCSFPNADGSCGNANNANCNNPTVVADPTLANVQSSPESIQNWIRHIQTQGYDLRFVAMDNEPELWGITHYDVHPNCTTYAEILDQYVNYATAVREVAPDVELTGPTTCCWYFYWNSAAGDGDKASHDNQDFIPWFLDQMRTHEETNGDRILDVLDIHYYPANVYNNEVDSATAALRLRSTRSLWDPSYSDESWIDEPIYLIPRMKDLIDTHYPDTPLAISEWNWGADETMNGALAVADVLGIMGREEIYFAAYWRVPVLQSPGFYAFKMFTNFDNQGTRFGDTSVWAQSDNLDRVSSFAAVDSTTGKLHLMLINKQPGQAETVTLDVAGFEAAETAVLYQYSGGAEGITETAVSLDETGNTVTLPAYTISLLVLDPQ
ncbi:MAG: glycoside hydrolase family 44 protein [Chloroflexota bacterium]